MATFLNIPTDKFKEILGQQLGQVKGILRAKIKSAIRVLINKFKQRAIESATQNVVERLAPNLCEKTDDIKTGVSQVTDFGEAISSKLNKLTQVAGKILGPIEKLLSIVNIILSLPIPAAVPPGIGVPLSVPLKLGDVKQTVKEFVVKARQLAATINALVASVQAISGALDAVLARLQDVIALAETYCELLDALEDPDTDSGNLDEDFLREYNDLLYQLANALGLMLEGDDDGQQFDALGGDMLELIQEYELEEFIPEGIKSRLRRRRLPDNFNTRGGETSGTGLGDGLVLGPDGTPLNGTGGTGGTGGAGGDGTGFGDNATPEDNSELFEAIDGETYRLTVKDDPLSPEIALRRIGTAETLEGVVVLTSPPTFTTDARIILADIKVRLNTQLAIL